MHWPLICAHDGDGAASKENKSATMAAQHFEKWLVRAAAIIINIQYFFFSPENGGSDFRSDVRLGGGQAGRYCT